VRSRARPAFRAGPAGGGFLSFLRNLAVVDLGPGSATGRLSARDIVHPQSHPGGRGAGTGMRAARRLAGEGRPVRSSVCGRTRESLPRRGVKEASKAREEATVTLCFPGEKAV